MPKHIPVLLKEVLSYLNLEERRIVVDATLGAGGYSVEIAKQIAPNGTLIAIDRDADAVRSFREYAKEEMFWGLLETGMRSVHGNYSDIRNILHDGGIKYVDAIVADLGISSDQLDDPDRGLSFISDAPLDMRLDRSEETPTARDVVNRWEEESLATILFRNADEKYSRKIARKIIEIRKVHSIDTTKQLSEIVESVVPRKGSRIHPATKTFQAIRMEVNRELEHLEKFLREAISLLCPSGRLAVISFHSGEDRLVKSIFAEYSKGCVCPSEFPVCRCDHVSSIRILTKKPIIPTEEEIRCNPRSRCAKLRVVERIDTNP